MPSHYPHRLNPSLYPDYTRRPFRVPDWATFENKTQFASLRSLHQNEWREDLDSYTLEFKLGRVIWPMLHILHMPQLEEVVEELRKRRLYLFDLWSHVPGSSMEGMWSSITPPPGVVDYLKRTLGDRFLGIDNGEQDGRYVAGYARQQCPNFQDRISQYLNFHRHFERMCNDLGNHMSALVSLSFGHYFLKEGNHMLLGAETAQALPNSQIYYAFIRGACRQYGVHWFGNASVFNRWGYKNYEVEGGTPDAENMSACGADLGTSLSLLKRLLYTHILYNSVFVGFEMGWLKSTKTKDGKTTPGSRYELTPVGMIQQDAVQFVEQNGSLGTLHTPVALLLDFHAGWAVPRHLYSGDVYQVWGSMPYDQGDYLTHGVLSLLYPGYEDASFYHDERGFLSPTPYGDIADVVLSDVAPWALRQYGVVIVAGALTPGEEIRDTLLDFLGSGGQVLVTAENARFLFPDLEIEKTGMPFPAGREVKWMGGQLDREPHDFELCSAQIPPQAEILATCDGRPAVFRFAVGAGSCTVLLSPMGLHVKSRVSGAIKSEVDQPLECPYVLAAHVRRAIGQALAGQQLFTVGGELGCVTCRRKAGVYTVGIHNDSLQARPFRIEARWGTLRQVREIPLSHREKGNTGYWPTGMGRHDGGSSTATTIAGGDIRIFEVEVDAEQIQCRPEIRPPARPQNRFLSLRQIEPLQEALLRRPTFFHHFDGVKIDWRYVWSRDRHQIDRERAWLARQQVRLIVDFCHDLNFYPGLTLLNTMPNRYQESLDAIEETLGKAGRFGVRDLLMSLHRQPENHCSSERAEKLFVEAMQEVSRLAERHGMTVHLQYQRSRWWGFRWCNGPYLGALEQTLQFLEKVQSANLKLALDVGHSAWNGESLSTAVQLAGSRLGMILYSAPRRDLFGQVYDAHDPIASSGLDVSAVTGLTGIPQVLDGVYADPDAEYRDCRAVWGDEASLIP